MRGLAELPDPRQLVGHDDPAQLRQFRQDRLPAGQLGGALEHDHLCGAVQRHVLELLGAERGVHGGGHGAQVQRGQIDKPVLRPAGHHDQHVGAGRQADLGQAAGEHGHLVVQLRPRTGVVAAQCAQRRKVAERRGVAVQQCRDGQIHCGTVNED
ncbi:hypothetical protein Adi01nite_01420 [Amorphoplanes digitatis]|nr:hypothetical protein GCM10020092_034880 [Actinoplanes digitatis]GID90730.1 hypothetical protein Adi01nite_01420 [Actinoplanes digitatis]